MLLFAVCCCYCCYVCVCVCGSHSLVVASPQTLLTTDGEPMSKDEFARFSAAAGGKDQVAYKDLIKLLLSNNVKK